MDHPVCILGIDPGTRNVGFGVVAQRGAAILRLAGGCISAGDGPVALRLVTIYRGLREVIERHRPAAAAVETVFTGANPKTAIAIGEGRGVAVLAAAESGLEVCGYEPALVKRAVAGSGRADKEQVRQMVRAVLGLPDLPATDHEADALAMAITHLRHARAASLVGGSPVRGKPGRSRRALPDLVLRQLPGGVAPRSRR
ncbi:MAG: crossover junction endodeoxyribonuclease RuvC [Planctomycetes bacterium]|nr:crossover junction endodeoxyribonuclease RuvC [Planctomycetota bacterium]